MPRHNKQVELPVYNPPSANYNYKQRQGQRRLLHALLTKLSSLPLETKPSFRPPNVEWTM